MYPPFGGRPSIIICCFHGGYSPPCSARSDSCSDSDFCFGSGYSGSDCSDSGCSDSDCSAFSLSPFANVHPFSDVQKQYARRNENYTLFFAG